jgi:hypothetical protein
MVLCVLPFAVCGCDNDTAGIGASDFTDSGDENIPAIETASYLPLNSSSALVYSDGEKVYEARYMGEINAAGVRAVKFGSALAYNLYSVDSDSINLCGDEKYVFDMPLVLYSKKAGLYTSSTSSVVINGQKTIVSSFFRGNERITTNAGTFDTIKFQMTYSDVETGAVNYMREINLAKNVGIVADKITTNGLQNAITLIAGTTETAVYTKPKKEWAFLIYSCGHNPSNDLSAYLYNQLKQFENTGIGKNAHVVAQISPTNEVLSGIATRFALENDKLVAVKSITGRTVDTGNTSEILSFYNWAVDAYPAEHYALFISGHGSGAISILYPDGDNGAPAKAIAYDDTAKNSLKLYELSEVYRNITAKIGKKIDVIVFDSCVMQMFEVAYQLKEFGEYFVASQAALAGNGIDMLGFSGKFSRSSDHSALNVSKMLVDAYIESPGISNANLTMSVTRLSMCDQLKTLIDSFADGIAEIKSDTDAVAFILAVYGSQRFGSLNFDDYASGYVDLFDFAITLDRYMDSGAAKNAAMALINIEKEKSFVVYNRIKGDYFKAADGISIFIPKQSKDWINANYTRDQYRYFTDFGRDGKWYDFLNEWSVLLGNNGQ